MNAYTYYLDHHHELSTVVAHRILDHYEAWKNGSEMNGACDLPRIPDADGMNKLISLNSVYILEWVSGTVSYLGLSFDCPWDEEHGVGVLLHRSRVVSVGSVDVAICHHRPEPSAVESLGVSTALVGELAEIQRSNARLKINDHTTEANREELLWALAEIHQAGTDFVLQTESEYLQFRIYPDAGCCIEYHPEGGGGYYLLQNLSHEASAMFAIDYCEQQSNCLAKYPWIAMTQIF